MVVETKYFICTNKLLLTGLASDTVLHNSDTWWYKQLQTSCFGGWMVRGAGVVDSETVHGQIWLGWHVFE